MRISAKVVEVPAKLEVEAVGIILDLPVSSFADIEHPETAFHAFLKRSMVYCEYGNPELGEIKFGRLVEIADRMKCIDPERICGVLTDGKVEVVPGERVRVTAKFTPSGPYKDAAINLIKASEQLCLSARFLLNEQSKITQVPTWDVVTEVPEQPFNFGLILKNQ
ncbi:hypothetical protein STRATTON_135 [Erwinia phage vB_EamM_Stratton]|uniref:Uncharacterized protein n=1 Tax=Erwinia phage vB_EamM_Stratton TaxID=1883378 RepID=A0A1B2IH13_9CAUD|nr:hypothetical protein STRATTON_135 [Erwinia phage vB_EamM_Stratton]